MIIAAAVLGVSAVYHARGADNRVADGRSLLRVVMRFVAADHATHANH
jgi:hypothetical protein